MSDVKKLKIGTTSYDIKDDKALHIKRDSDGNAISNSVIEANSGTTTYPTNNTNNTDSTVIGSGAYIINASTNKATLYGYNAQANSGTNTTQVTAIGASARATGTQSTALGAASTSTGSQSVSIGYGSNSVSAGSIAIGPNSSTSSSGTTSNGAIAIGNTARTKNTYDVSIGYQAYTEGSLSGAVQLGNGTNTLGGLQYRSFQLVNNDGIIPIERIPTDLVVTTSDPLPNPETCSLGTTQMYLGPDTEDLQKNHMYSVVEDKNGHCAYLCDTYTPSAWPDGINIIKKIHLNDKELFYNKIHELSNGLHIGAPRDVTVNGLWKSVYIAIAYTGNGTASTNTDKFQIVRPYSTLVEYLQMDTDLSSWPQYTYDELESEFGITIDDWNTIPHPSAWTTMVYFVISDQFYVTKVKMPNNQIGHRFVDYCNLDYDKFKAWCEQPVRLGKVASDGTITGEMVYQLQSGDEIKMTWGSIGTAREAWKLTLTSSSLAEEYTILAPNTLIYPLSPSWTAGNLVRDWGITTVGQGGLAQASADLSGLSFAIGWNYGHKWAETTAVLNGGTAITINNDTINFDATKISGYVASSTQVLQNNQGTLKWGTGGLSSATWGSIAGTLANQTDLNTALSGKVDTTYYSTEAGGSNNIAGGFNLTLSDDSYSSVVLGDTIEITDDGTVATGEPLYGAVGIGHNVTLDSSYSVAIGDGTCSYGEATVAIGSDASATGQSSVALGDQATTSAAGAVQLGNGQNKTASTLQFRSYPLVNASGNIPKERLSTTAPASGQYLKYDGTNVTWGTPATGPTYTAGTNVQINNNVISATDTTYTAGNNVQITDGVISATDTTYTTPTALKAGVVKFGVANSTATDAVFTCKYITETLGLKADISKIFDEAFKRRIDITNSVPAQIDPGKLVFVSSQYVPVTIDVEG